MSRSALAWTLVSPEPSQMHCVYAAEPPFSLSQSPLSMFAHTLSRSAQALECYNTHLTNSITATKIRVDSLQLGRISFPKRWQRATISKPLILCKSLRDQQHLMPVRPEVTHNPESCFSSISVWTLVRFFTPYGSETLKAWTGCSQLHRSRQICRGNWQRRWAAADTSQGKITLIKSSKARLSAMEGKLFPARAQPGEGKSESSPSANQIPQKCKPWPKELRDSRTALHMLFPAKNPNCHRVKSMHEAITGVEMF